jgi:ATP-dependent RNA helicase RhlE
VPSQTGQGRGRRPGARPAGAGAPRGGKPQGRQNGPRNSDGASTGTPPAKRSGPRNGALVTARAVAKTRATAARPATTSLVRNRPCRTRGPGAEDHAQGVEGRPLPDT